MFIRTRMFTRTIAALAWLAICFWPLAAHADNVVEGFFTKGHVKTGQIVALVAKPVQTVELVPANSSNEIFGVAVDGSKAPITLDFKGQQVFVATGGDYPVLVSNENGPVEAGDYISISSTSGIGVKATPNQPVILGQADTFFNGQQNVVGHDGKYSIGRLKASISVRPNPLFKNTLAIPQPLQKLGNSIAGQEVPPFRVYMALLIFIVATALAVILLTVGIRSGLVAIGRNPLSQHTILQGLFEVIAVSLAIFVTSIVGVYLLLRI